MHFDPRRLGAWTRRTLARPLRRFVRHRGGAVAIEFPLILVPFLAFLYAIMETALVFFANQVLETGAQEAARLVMTGQAQAAKFDQSTFKTAVCARMTGWLDCANKMSIDVRTFASFSSVEMPSPLNPNGTLASGGYNLGGPGEIVVVRLSYEFPIAIKLWNPNLANMAGDNRLIVATAAFRNEPYNN